MSDKSHIEWTDATWNPITGCTLVSEGCRHCYAATLAATRLKHHPSRAGLARVNAAGEAKFTGEVRFNDQWLDQPLRWRRPRMVFVCAHGDLFHESVPDKWIDRVFAVMALAPQHTFQLLTKRPERMRDYINGTQSKAPFFGRMPLERIYFEAAGHMGGDGGFMDTLKQQHSNIYSLYLDAPWPLPNVWVGVSAEDQKRADERIPDLLATPAAVRFVSAEPLLGHLDLARWLSIAWRCSYCLGYFGGQHQKSCPDCGRVGGWSGSHPFNGRKRPERPLFPPQSGRGIDWVIVGGESGPGARPMHPDWARSLRDQCKAAEVPYFFKQWGEWAPGEVAGPNERPIDAADWHCDHWSFYRVGKAQPDQHYEDEPDVFRIGKKQSGRTLDGCTWDEMPSAKFGRGDGA